MGNKIKSQLQDSKIQRELFSYSFPASGFTASGFEPESLDCSIKIARLFTDLTQLNSACLEASVDKHGNPPFDFDGDAVIKCTAINSREGVLIFDYDDCHRSDYFMRKTDKPYCIFSLATEGLVEDFFGAWVDHHEITKEGGYDPDCDWHLLMSVR